MKFLKVFFSVIAVVILLAVVLLFVFIQTFDINRYKPEITKQISRAVDRDVRIGSMKLDFSWTSGATIGISKLEIVDNKDFDYGNFLDVDSVTLNVDVMEYVRSRRLKISRVELNRPRVNVVILNDGRVNIPGSDAPPPDPKATNNTDAEALNIKTVVVNNGFVRIINRAVDPVMMIPVADLNLKISDFFFKKPVSFDLACALFGSQPNVAVRGKIIVDPDTQVNRFENMVLNVDFQSFSIEDMKAKMAAVMSAIPLDQLQGKLDLNIGRMETGPSGLTSLSADGEVKNFTLLIAGQPPLQNLTGTFHVTERDLELKNIDVPLAGGVVNLKGTVEDYLIQKKFVLDVHAKDVSVPEAMKLIPGFAMPQGTGAEGRVTANITAQGNAFDPNKIMDALSASGTLSVAQGKIQGLNIMQNIMAKIDRLSQIVGPDLKQRLLEKLPTEYLEKLKINETPIHQMETAFELKDQKIYFSKTNIGVEEGNFLADGNIDFTQNISIQPQIFVNPALSKVIIDALTDLKPLLGADGRISVPLLPYNGPLAQMKALPDTDYLIKTLAGARIKNELKGVVKDSLNLPVGIVDAVFGDGTKTKTDPVTGEQVTEDKTIKSQQESTPGKAIGGVLDSILGN